jgi:Transposase DDE domain group 1
MDATIIESRKQEALRTYAGERGYQPMLAVWAEMDVVLADQFRDGNVPAMMAPLAVAQQAFGVLPPAGMSYYFRGDSACHEYELLRWLRDEKRVQGPQGYIGFAVSARMTEALHQAILRVREEDWQAYGSPHASEIRECAEVDFVPGEKTERKDSLPLRYVAIRLRLRQEELFQDGSKERHFAIVSNIGEWSAERLIQWHREKAGTVEGVHNVVKNELAGGVMPCKYFGANAAWLRLVVIAHNVLTALKRLALPAELLRARPKRLRFLIFNTAGRLVRHARSLVLRLAATAEEIALWREARQLLPVGT